MNTKKKIICYSTFAHDFISQRLFILKLVGKSHIDPVHAGRGWQDIDTG